MNKIYSSIMALIMGCSYSPQDKEKEIDVLFPKPVVEQPQPQSLDSYFPPLSQFPAGWTQQSLHCGLDLRVFPLKYQLQQECFQVYHGPHDEFLSVMADMWEKEETLDEQIKDTINFYTYLFPELRKVFLRNTNTLFLIQQNQKETSERINNIVDYMLENNDDLTKIDRNF